jgi:hypothetical protein
VSTSTEFGAIDNAKLAGLIFELASQLHVERARRLALEAALAARGLVPPDAIESAGDAPALRAAAAEAADAAIRALLRVLSESVDERAPLRGEAPHT